MKIFNSTPVIDRSETSVIKIQNKDITYYSIRILNDDVMFEFKVMDEVSADMLEKAAKTIKDAYSKEPVSVESIH